MKKWMTTLAVAVCLLAASNAQAVILPPDALFPPPTVGVAPWGPLTFVAGMSSPYAFSSGSRSFSGILDSLAYTEPGGTMTFFYQVHAVAGTENLNRLSVTGFTGSSTDVYWVTDPGLLPPQTGGLVGTVGLFNFTRAVGGDTVGANFLGGLAPGSDSNWMVVRTNATTFSQNPAYLQDGGQANALAFSPAPLPGTFVLFGTGALGLIGFLRRKRPEPIGV